ncbi:MAG TPA: RloB family protein [Verrucomicrobiae bacterium]|nr:RloB family protein [Verrucomicrobiae bacterium]
MSLLNRKPISIGRAQRTLRDDRVFVVATDDTYAPAQYFEHLPLSRVKVIVLATPLNSGLSAPAHVVDRLKDAFSNVRRRGEIQSGDEFWVLLDTDHHFRDQNLPGTLEAMRQARQAGLEVAVSNPCFELWLLLHHEDVPLGTVFANADAIVQRLRTILGEYNKTNIKTGHFPLTKVPDAIRRALVLQNGPAGPWPEETGTHVYLLMQRVLPLIA